MERWRDAVDSFGGRPSTCTGDTRPATEPTSAALQRRGCCGAGPITGIWRAGGRRGQAPSRSRGPSHTAQLPTAQLPSRQLPSRSWCLFPDRCRGRHRSTRSQPARPCPVWTRRLKTCCMTASERIHPTVSAVDPCVAPPGPISSRREQARQTGPARSRRVPPRRLPAPAPLGACACHPPGLPVQIQWTDRAAATIRHDSPRFARPTIRQANPPRYGARTSARMGSRSVHALPLL